MKCLACKEKIVKELSAFDSIKIDEIDVDKQSLVLLMNEKSPSTLEIQDIIENKLKLNTIIRGTGNFIAAVCELSGSKNSPNVIGVIRFIQNAKQQCLIDAVIDGLEPTKHYQLNIHEYGDLSDPNYATIGNKLHSIEKDIAPTDKKLIVKKKIHCFDLPSMIGRSLAIETNKKIAGAGIIARASKILDNTKKICACSGKTLWQERETKILK